MHSTETIRNFLLRAFSDGTIPFPRSGHSTDPTRAMHYAFNLSCWVEGAEPDREPAALIAHWPMWPPDMFAAMATLLEQSGSYLRMVHCEAAPKAPRGPATTVKSWPVDAHQIVNFTKEYGHLSFHDDVLKVCRVIGALWRAGCLFISGDDGRSASAEIPPPKVIWNLQRNCFDALRDLEVRYRMEFDEADVNSIAQTAVDEMRGREVFSHRPNGSNANYVLANATGLATDDTYLLTAIILNKLTTVSDSRWFSRPAKRPNPQDQDRRSEFYASQFEVTLCLWAIDFIATLWRLVRDWGGPYVLPRANWDGALQDWQVASALLLIIADEGGRSTGFTAKSVSLSDAGPVEQSASAPPPKDAERQVLRTDVIGLGCREMWQAHASVLYGSYAYPRNLARCFDESIAAVMPKARTPAAGCTIRSLSHHLALMPAKGRIRTRWAPQGYFEEHQTFNLLLVPYPFEILSADVVPLTDDLTDDTGKRSGRFSIKPLWLDRTQPVGPTVGPKPRGSKAALRASAPGEQFWEFIAALIADQPQGIINGIVFPEGSLTPEVFNLVADRIAGDKSGRYDSITLLTGGLARECPKGNLVAAYMRKARTDEKPTTHIDWHVKHSRSKHHRWSLNKSQLATYALSNRLPPNRIWWEDITLPPREMLFAEFSRGSVLTSLICEDLARIDPCQAALRAVGPNFTLVLLMDSAQIASQWPSQYAGVLADDPGTSVLTLTSFGLLRRSNLSDGHKSRAIALWREPYGGPARSIELPEGHHAQLLSLRRDKAREVTLDGRGDAERAVVWRLSGVVPIKVAQVAWPPGLSADFH